MKKKPQKSVEAVNMEVFTSHYISPALDVCKNGEISDGY